MSAEDAFRFAHILIRDAAYSGIPKAQRAELHERLADWIEVEARDAPASTRRSSATTSSRPIGSLSELGPAKRAGRDARPARRRAARVGGPAGLRPRRHAGCCEPALASRCAPPGPGAGARRSSSPSSPSPSSRRATSRGSRPSSPRRETPRRPPVTPASRPTRSSSDCGSASSRIRRGGQRRPSARRHARSPPSRSSATSAGWRRAGRFSGSCTSRGRSSVRPSRPG